MPYQLIWLIFLLPVFSFIINGLIIRPFVKKESKIAGYITIAAVASCLALSLWTLASVMAAQDHQFPFPI